MSGAATEALSLTELNAMVASALAREPRLRQVWVVAELSDVRVAGGHCYMELIEKDADTGTVMARMRGIIWQSSYRRIAAEFMAATGRRPESGMKVLACGTVNFHPAYGMSLVISDIDASYALGDLMRRRRMIIERLRAEGMLDMNVSLPWPEGPLRLAVVSARGAAGYGDFLGQLAHNSARLRFSVRLFEAVMQGERTEASLIAALEDVARRSDEFDAVVIIRGGGATSDLASFDSYHLAANVAQFPLPVIVGIGHDRDSTVLDTVAAVSVKTPTAAAQWLIARGESQLARLAEMAAAMARSVSERLTGNNRQLAFIAGLLPAAARTVIERARERVGARTEAMIADGARARLSRCATRIADLAGLVDALSPEATLRRGFAVARVDGRAVTDAALVKPGSTVTVTVARGTFEATAH